MYKIAKPLFFRCITPMHVGCGSDLGIVDLPIQREKHTGYPKIESSGIKGCIREYFETTSKDLKDEVNVHKLFGYDQDSISKDHKDDIKNIFKDNLQYSGAIGFTDARILFFPVKSIKGVFAWVTCPQVLKKLKEELDIANVSLTYTNKKVESQKAYCTSECELIVSNADERDKEEYIILEEYQFEVEREKKDELKKLADKLQDYIGIDNLSKKLVIVNDNDFKDFVTMCTEVITRTKIDNESGAVKDGALFTQEYLPSETIMYDLVLFSPTFYPDNKDDEHLKRLTAEGVRDLFYKKGSMVIQIGSGSTIGKGIVKINTVNVNKVGE